MKTPPPKVPHLVWHWNAGHARAEKFVPVPFPSLAEARAAVASAKLREVAYVNATTGEMTDSEGVHRSRVPTYVKAIKEHFAKIGVAAPSAAPAPSPTVAPTIRPPAPASRTAPTPRPAIAPPPLARPETTVPARVDLLDDDAAEEDDAFVASAESRTPTEPIRFTRVNTTPPNHTPTPLTLGDDLTEFPEFRAPALNEALRGASDVGIAARLAKALDSLKIYDALVPFCGEHLDGLFSLLVAARDVGGCEKATEILRMLHKQFGAPRGEQASG